MVDINTAISNYRKGLGDPGLPVPQLSPELLKALNVERRIGLSDLFPKGCLVYDKETDTIFEYKKSKHKKRILENPNNYRRAHKGDFK